MDPQHAAAPSHPQDDRQQAVYDTTQGGHYGKLLQRRIALSE